jgi:hypothetical protein
MSYECPDCGDEFSRLGQHWAMGLCQPPELSDYQKEVLTGLLMGDGTVSQSAKGTVRIEANMVSDKYLMYLDDQFPVYGRGVRRVYTAEENAKRDRESGFNETATSDNYSDTYRWSTMMAPVFNEYADWYESGKKVWPNTEFTSTILKHLYCCDGYRHDSSSHDNIIISMNNEVSNTEKVESMFSRAGLPVPSWQIYEKNGRTDCSARFTKDESQQLWEYMGEPLPGFEYKWP